MSHAETPVQQHDRHADREAAVLLRRGSVRDTRRPVSPVHSPHPQAFVQSESVFVRCLLRATVHSHESLLERIHDLRDTLSVCRNDIDTDVSRGAYPIVPECVGE